MAEDQDKQKPKATLIKHRKEDRKEDAAKEEQAEAGGDHKKVKVVIKKKPKVKVVAKKPAEKTETSQESHATPTPGDATKPADNGTGQSKAPPTPVEEPPKDEVKWSSARIEAEGPITDRPIPKKTTKPADRPGKESRVTEGRAETSRQQSQDQGRTARKTEPSQRSDADTATPQRSTKDDTTRKGDERPSSDSRGRGERPVDRRSDYRSDRRQEGRRDTGSFRPKRSDSGRSGPPGRTGTGGRSAPAGRGQQRSAGRPGSGGPPRPTGRPGSGGPQRSTGRPGSGPPPRGGSPAPEKDAGKRSAGRRFYRSKKTDEYRRDEYQQQEKEISLSRKRPKHKANPVPKEIDIMEVVTVSELARKMNLKASELIGKLMNMGMMVTINQQIDADTAEILAGEYGCKVKIVSLYDETLIETEQDKVEELETRPPIVTVMGHVDHGKTKLLDAIRSTNVVGDEHGGITQHIGAYQVTLPQGKLTFLDTPGHEAFTLMRARGAQITDIVILVVAADDGVMPQTVEAINHAKEAKVPIIVAVNKVDKEDANPDRVRQQLSDHELIPEQWGGSTIFVDVSALKREGIDELLESVLLQSEMMELKANFDRTAEGKIVESRIDQGRGTVATVLIEKGTLRIGDSFVAGVFPGKVRAMFNDRGKRIQEAGPAMPVEIIGLDGVPEAGDPFQVTENEKTARQVGSKRQELKRVEEAQNVKKITLDNLYDSIQEGAVQELKVVIKGDVHGSVEALTNALERLSTSEIRLSVIHASAGAINEGDVVLAAASNAIVVGFHVRPTPRAIAAAEREKVEIRKYNIIYDAVEDIRSAMEGMLAPDLKEEQIGTVDVRDTFRVPKIGVIAGCYVTDGKVRRNANIRVFRDGVQVHEGKITSLKRFKDDVREVDSGYECGIGIENFNDLAVGDQLEVFVVKEVAKKLTEPGASKK